jgi:hypothetical protein
VTSSTHDGHFASEERTPGNWVYPRANIERVAKRKIPVPINNRTLGILSQLLFTQSSAYNGTKMDWSTILLENEAVNFSY